MKEMKTTPEVYTYGFDDIDKRTKTLRSKVNKFKNLSKKVAKDALVKQKLYKEYSDLAAEAATRLDSYFAKAKEDTKRMRASGRERIDGKRALALRARGLEETCGIVEAKTLVSCTSDKVELKEMFWAYNWVVEMLKDLSTQINTTEMNKFYNTIENYKGNPDDIKSEAGLTALGKF